MHTKLRYFSETFKVKQREGKKKRKYNILLCEINCGIPSFNLDIFKQNYTNKQTQKSMSFPFDILSKIMQKN